MKNILVPTDFSENSLNALQYAIDIANHFASHITLLYTYNLISTTGSLGSVERIIREDAEKDIAAIIKKHAPALKEGQLLESKVVPGNAVSVIVNIADKSDYDLIVMGTQGASGILDVFIGSTTNAVMKNADTPVLAIPNGMKFKPFQKIVFAVDNLEIDSSGVLHTLTQLAGMYQAYVLVFHQGTAKKDQGIDSAIDEALGDTPHSFYFRYNDMDINESIHQFVEEEQADLLCMIRRKRSIFSRLFFASHTTKEVFDIQTPILILHD